MLTIKIKYIFNIFTNALRKSFFDTIKHDGIEHAGYLSFLGILSLFPFLVFLVSLLGQIGDTELGFEFTNLLLANIPKEVSVALEPRINEIISGPPQSLLTIAVLGAIWTASGTVEGLRTIFNRAYRVSTPPSYILRRLTSIAQFILITFLIITAMFIIILIPIILERLIIFKSVISLYGILEHALKLRFLFSTIIIFSAVSFIYYVIPNVKQKLINISDYQKDLAKYIEFGLKLIQNLDTFFLQGDIQIKNKLLSSILDEKMEFDGVKYRTPKFKESFRYIYKKINELQHFENKTGDKISNVSRLVLEMGLEPIRPLLIIGF